ncbi:hypothetical protein QJS10_CPA07g01382 [Acorus calamus]|uniref:Protein kinase domain-containing protein n=1 Tax=Acorus calamus TaxID=4465 RepID=A0AAV9EIU2_ACOCL|nr:hypothetical protein QJS10_CPA07g01382 [Acorus calamus]
MWNPEFGKENLENLEKMEEGEDNKVYKARQKTTGKLLLIKKYKNLCLDEDGTLPPSRLCEIIDFEALSESSNVLRLLYWYKNEKPSLYMMFEFLNMDLKKFIDSNPTPIQPNLIQSFMYQLCKELHIGTSLSCFTAEMMLGSTLFPGDSEYDMLLHIFRLHYDTVM